MNTRYDPRADKITVAITEAIIVSQRDHEHPSLAYVETDTTLEALAVVAARIAFETKIADTAAKGATFAEQHAEMVGQTLKALRKSGDQHSFARVRGASPMAGSGQGGMDGVGGGPPAASQARPEPARQPRSDGSENQKIGTQ